MKHCAPLVTVVFNIKDKGEKQAGKHTCRVLQHSDFKVIVPLQLFLCCHRTLKATLDKSQEEYPVC